MATVMRPAVLTAVYEETLRSINSIPTMLIPAGRTIYRSVPSRYLPQPLPGGHVSKAAASMLYGREMASLNRITGSAVLRTTPRFVRPERYTVYSSSRHWLTK
jgi:hypothetical protein